MDQRAALLEAIRAALEPELKAIQSKPLPRSLMVLVRFKHGTLIPRAVVVSRETELNFDKGPS